MRRGVTLLELVIAIAVGAIISIPIGLLISEHLGAVLWSHASSVAAPLARAEMEYLDSLNDFFAPDLAEGTTVIPNYQGYPYDVTRTITCQLGNCVSTAENRQGVKRIEISVVSSGSTAVLMRLISYRTKHVTFGS